MYSIFASAHALICTDIPGLSRFDATSLPQQTLMELLVQDIRTDKFQNADGDHLEACAWPEVSCNMAKDVESITFCLHGQAFFPDGGTIHIDFIPQTVETFIVSENNLEGTCDTWRLPREMNSFFAHYNRLHGSFDLAGLPRDLFALSIAQNRFSGGLSIGDLPPQLTYFNAECNFFTGSLDLGKLPETLSRFTVDRDRFEADFSRMPKVYKF